MAGLWQAQPAKPQVLPLIPKEMGKEDFKQGQNRVSFIFYNSSDCFLKTDQRLPLEKPFKALECGNPIKVTICKIKTQFLPGDVSSWEAGSGTAVRSVSRVVGRPAGMGCRSNRRHANVNPVQKHVGRRSVQKNGWRSHEVGETPLLPPPTRKWLCSSPLADNVSPIPDAQISS